MNGPRRLVATTLLLLLAAGVLTLAWMEGGKYFFEPRKWGVVEADGFFRSGQIHARLVEDVLREHRIDLIVDLAARDPEGDRHERAEREVAERLGIRRLTWRLRSDGSAEPAQYAQALAEVIRARRAGQRVLVHCNAGRERTGTLVGLYRLLVDGWDLDRAYTEYLGFRKREPKRRRVRRYWKQHATAVRESLVAEGLVAPL